MILKALIISCLLALLVPAPVNGLSTNQTTNTTATDNNTNANNWSQPVSVTLTTTSPPTRTEMFHDWYDQPHPLLTSESNPFESERTVSTTTSPTKKQEEELCAPENSGEDGINNNKNSTSIRVASNCRTTVQKPGTSNSQLLANHRQSFLAEMSAPKLFNYSNNFISPQTIHVKTSPNGEITVINGKSVTPILYEHERPLVYPTFEQLTSKNTIVTKTKSISDEADAKKTENDLSEDDEGDDDDDDEEEEDSNAVDKNKTSNDDDKDHNTNLYSQSSTSTSTTSTTIASPITTTERPRGFSGLTRRPNLMANKAKYGDKMLKPPMESAPSDDKRTTFTLKSVVTSKPTRKPLNYITSTSTTTPKYSKPISNDMNSRINALKARYHKKVAHDPPIGLPKPGNPSLISSEGTGNGGKVSVEYTTTTTTTTESLLKYDIEHSEEEHKKTHDGDDEHEDNSINKGPIKSDNQWSPYSRGSSSSPKPLSYNATGDSSTENPSLSNETIAVATETSKTQIPEPYNIRFQLEPTTPGSAASQHNHHKMVSQQKVPQQIRINHMHLMYGGNGQSHHQSNHPPPQHYFNEAHPTPVRMSLPQNAYYNPTMELSRIKPIQNFARNPTMDSQSGENTTPGPEVFVTIENQYIIVRNGTAIEEAIPLPNGAMDPQNESTSSLVEQIANKLGSQIKDTLKRNKIIKNYNKNGDQHISHQEPTSFYHSDRPHKPPVGMASSGESKQNPANMYFYYEDNNNQPKYKFPVMQPSGDQPQPQMKLFDQINLSPELAKHLTTFTQMNEPSNEINYNKPIDIGPNHGTPITFHSNMPSMLQNAPSSGQATSQPHKTQNESPVKPNSGFQTSSNSKPIDGDAPFRLVRHYLRTYAYNDKDPKPTSIEFDNQLNVALKDVHNLPSVTSDMLRLIPPSSPLVNQPSGSLLNSDNGIGTQPPFVGHVQPMLNGAQMQNHHIHHHHQRNHAPRPEVVQVLNLAPVNTNNQKQVPDFQQILSHFPQQSGAHPRPGVQHQQFGSRLPQGHNNHLGNGKTNEPLNSELATLDYILRNPNFISEANLLSIDQRPQEAMLQTAPMFAGKMLFSDEHDHPLMPMDSNIYQSKRPYPMFQGGQQQMAQSHHHGGISFGQQNYRDQRKLPLFSDDVSMSESQAHEVLKTTHNTDPFEEYYSDRILPFNSMMDFPVMFMGSNRMAKIANGSAQPNVGMSAKMPDQPNYQTNNIQNSNNNNINSNNHKAQLEQLERTTKSKLLELFSLLAPNSQVDAQSTSESKMHMLANLSPQPNPQLVPQMVAQASNREFNKQPQLDQSKQPWNPVNTPLVLPRLPMSSSFFPLPSPPPSPKVDNRSRRNRRIIGTLRAIFGSLIPGPNQDYMTLKRASKE